MQMLYSVFRVSLVIKTLSHLICDFNMLDYYFSTTAVVFVVHFPLEVSSLQTPETLVRWVYAGYISLEIGRTESRLSRDVVSVSFVATQRLLLYTP